jgi:hypothetical protein
METNRLVTLATQTIDIADPMYYTIDFLNRTLKEKGLVFGLTKGEEEGTLQIAVYEERETEN